MSESKYGNIYVDRAIDFLRGETGHFLIFGHRAWLPPGTTFDRLNAEYTDRIKARLNAALEAGDMAKVRAFADDILKGRGQESAIGASDTGDEDGDRWRALADGDRFPEEFGRRFLLVTVHGEAQMWCTSWDTQDDLCKAIADLIGDADYGFAAAVDLDTMQMLRPTATVTLTPVGPGAEAEYQPST